MSVYIKRESDGPDTIVRVDGRLCKENVADLEGECESFEGRLTLELSGLTFTDDDGVRILNHFASRGAHMHGVSPYIRLLLARPGV